SERQEAEQLVNEARVSSSETQALALLNRAAALCPELASLYVARARIAQANHHPEAIQAAWQRLLDIASATPQERRQAQEALGTPSPLFPLSHAAGEGELRPSLSIVSSNLLEDRGRDSWLETGSSSLNRIMPTDREKRLRLSSPSPAAWERGKGGEGSLFTIEMQPASRLSVLTPPGAQEGTLALSFDPSEAGEWLTLLLNTRGLEVSAYLTAEDRARRPLTPPAHGRNPTLRWQAQPGRYRLVVTHDPGKDGYLLPFNLDGVLKLSAPSPTPPPRPVEQWRYTLRNDGSALVSVTVDGPDVVLLPKTAETPEGAGAEPRYHLDMPGALARLAPSAFAYDSRLEDVYALGDGLLVSPGPGQKQVRLSFVWPDAAYDIPMTHYATDHVHKHFFASLRGINPDTPEVEVTALLPSSATAITRTVPLVEPQRPTSGSAGPSVHWSLPPDKPAILDAENPQLATAWISARHRNMTVWLPDCPEYRRWQPDYMRLLGRIYDRESAVMGGYQTQEERFLYVTAPAQLSGYGGATWGDRKLSETWIACDGRVGAYNLQAQPGGDGVEAHELKWVHLGGAVPDLPRWLQDGTILWMEEQGKLAGGTAFPDLWTWEELAPKSRQYEVAYAGRGPGAGFVWMDAAAFGKLTAEERALTSAMDWRICQTLFERYGETFWPRFWQKERQTPDAFKNLSEEAKTRKVVEDMAALTGDPAVRDLFRRWGFRL
ncbi:MAG TPA: hypothetical protein VKT32_14455, partial [Chthonomonadaceae bacterium]|nr:hypothetical protein [Chthonomonadaceae bacterium]